jgi:hypothetical protein
MLHTMLSIMIFLFLFRRFGCELGIKYAERGPKVIDSGRRRARENPGLSMTIILGVICYH